MPVYDDALGLWNPQGMTSTVQGIDEMNQKNKPNVTYSLENSIEVWKGSNPIFLQNW